MKKAVSLFRTGSFSAIGFVLLTLIIWTPAHGAISDYVGTYSGTYSGEDQGVWIFIAEPSGKVDTYCWSTDLDAVESGSVTLDESGNISGSNNWETWIEATVSETGEVSGTFTGSQMSATIDGNLQPQASRYEGTYTGILTGDDNGTWEFIIESSGRLTVTIDTSQSETTVYLMGAINNQGEMIASNQSGLGLYAIIDGDNVNGIWSETESSRRGILDGSKNNNDASSDEDDGTGGCFIFSCHP